MPSPTPSYAFGAGRIAPEAAEKILIVIETITSA
jgi:hypothetical protein